MTTALTVPSRAYPLRAHPVQTALVNSPARFCVVPAGRRSGKTERAKRKLVKMGLNPPRLDARYFAGAPTRDQAKRIYWNDLKALIPRYLMTSAPSESELSIKLVTGAEICVVGMDRPQRIEGSPWDGGVLDEYANMRKGAWDENVRPALSDRNGWCWLIGVPEGRNHYYEQYQYALTSGDPEWAAFTWKSADILDPKEVASARRSMDPLTFQQEYEASFVNFEGRAYYCFLVETHCRKLTYFRRAPLIFCFDFNVDPGVAVVLQEQGAPELDAFSNHRVMGTAVIGEVHIPRNSNTPAVCRKLIEDWKDHEGRIEVYGDATGGNRGSAKTEGSDWDLVKRELYAGFGAERVKFRVPKANPPERARLNAMNSRLMSGDKKIHLYVDPVAAPHTVKDLEGVRLLEGGSGEIDKKHDPALSHLSDALGYYVESVFPVKERGHYGMENMYGH